MLDTHKMVMEGTTRFLNDAHTVFSATHEVDYDQEGKICSAWRTPYKFASKFLFSFFFFLMCSLFRELLRFPANFG